MKTQRTENRRKNNEKKKLRMNFVKVKKRKK